MTIKNLFVNALNDSARKCSDMRDKIWHGYQNYNPTEAEKEANRIQEEMNAYIDSKQEEVTNAVSRQIEDMEAFWSSQAKNRATDVNYQASLATAIQIIPAAIDSTSPEDLKERLAIFNDDPIAIGALRTALEAATKDDKTHNLKGMSNNYALPTDTRQSRKETLLQLAKTVWDLLNEMRIQVRIAPSYGAENINQYDFQMISGPYPISSTLDYIAACSDDCTVYDRSKYVVNKQEINDIKWDYKLGFTRQRNAI